MSAEDFVEYENTGVYNLRDGTLNRMIADLKVTGHLTMLQHRRLKKRLESCELNVHLDERPDAKRYGPFVFIKGGL